MEISSDSLAVFQPPANNIFVDLTISGSSFITIALTVNDRRPTYLRQIGGDWVK